MAAIREVSPKSEILNGENSFMSFISQNRVSLERLPQLDGQLLSIRDRYVNSDEFRHLMVVAYDYLTQVIENTRMEAKVRSGGGKITKTARILIDPDRFREYMISSTFDARTTEQDFRTAQTLIINKAALGSKQSLQAMLEQQKQLNLGYRNEREPYEKERVKIGEELLGFFGSFLREDPEKHLKDLDSFLKGEDFISEREEIRVFLERLAMAEVVARSGRIESPFLGATEIWLEQTISNPNHDLLLEWIEIIMRNPKDDIAKMLNMFGEPRHIVEWLLTTNQDTWHPKLKTSLRGFVAKKIREVVVSILEGLAKYRQRQPKIPPVPFNFEDTASAETPNPRGETASRIPVISKDNSTHSAISSRGLGELIRKAGANNKKAARIKAGLERISKGIGQGEILKGYFVTLQGRSSQLLYFAAEDWRIVYALVKNGSDNKPTIVVTEICHVSDFKHRYKLPN